jgi:hypothetical protein
MNREDFHPHGGAGLQAEPVGRTLDSSQRRRIAARIMLVGLLFGAVGAGALADLGLRWLGLRWPPIFTLLWGIGALLAVGVGWTRFELRAAEARAAERRERGDL